MGRWISLQNINNDNIRPIWSDGHSMRSSKAARGRIRDSADGASGTALRSEPMENIKVLYEDNDIIVVNKPAGLATEGGRIGEKDLESEMRNYLAKKKEPPEIFVVHRLDKPVSGIVVLAKNAGAAAVLSKSLSGDSFSKEYTAVVYKTGPLQKENELTDYLIKDVKNNVSRVAKSPGEKGAKKAALKYRVESEDENSAVLKIRLLTGRHHQIRVQLSNAGFPLLGDRKYGSKESIEYSLSRGIKDVLLTACALSFDHPATGEHMSFTI